MNLLSQGRCVLLSCVLGLILLTLGQVVIPFPLAIGVTVAGAISFLFALWGLWGLRSRFQQMLDEFQAQQPKS